MSWGNYMLRRKMMTGVVAAAVASGALLSLAPAAHADLPYVTLNCADTLYPNVQVCIERGQTHTNYKEGSLYNSQSGSDVYNLGTFVYSTGQTAFTCNNGVYVHSYGIDTSHCGPVVFPAGSPQVKVCDRYLFGSAYYTRCTAPQNSF